MPAKAPRMVEGMPMLRIGRLDLAFCASLSAWPGAMLNEIVAAANWP